MLTYRALTKPTVAKDFEIQLDSPFAVFFGEPHEADPVEVTGTLVLNNPDSINVRNIKIRLEGKWRVSWFVEPTVSTLQIRDRGVHYRQEQVLYPAEGVSNLVAHKIAPGRHEWRFKFTLDSTLPESVEGLPGSHIVYDLTADIDRGYMIKKMIATKRMRVVRTLGRDITDTVPMPYSNEDSWRDKVWYKIYLPTRYYIFGTSVTPEFTLCPLNKGLRIGKIRLEIIERVTLNTDEGRFKTRQSDHVVATHEQELPHDAMVPLTEETSGIADQSYHFKLTLPLQKSLNQCRQTVDTEHIKVWHNLKIYINLHNSDGHISQLLIRNLLHIYISPNLPIGDDRIMSAAPVEIAQVSDAIGQVDAAPPMYGTHQLDELYDDLAPIDYVSGGNTPNQYGSMSRAHSNEDLRAGAVLNNAREASDAAALQSQLEAVARGKRPVRSPSPQRYGDIPRISSRDSVEMSSSRLSNSTTAYPESSTRMSNSTAATTYPPSSSPGSTTPSFRYTQHSREPSDIYGGGNNANNQAFLVPASLHPTSANSTSFYDPEALSRVPSYTTAVRTPLASPKLEGLPSYDVAISRPASPQLGPRSPTSPGPSTSYSESLNFLPSPSQSPPKPAVPITSVLPPNVPPPPPPSSSVATPSTAAMAAPLPPRNIAATQYKPTMPQSLVARSILAATMMPPLTKTPSPPAPNNPPPPAPAPTSHTTLSPPSAVHTRPMSGSAIPDSKPTYLGLPPGLARPRSRSRSPSNKSPAPSSEALLQATPEASGGENTLQRTDTTESARRRALSDLTSGQPVGGMGQDRSPMLNMTRRWKPDA